MNSYRRWWQAILAAFVLVLVGTLWVSLAPVQLGGQASYVIVNGSSMEPNFHLGDLAILRKASDYQVGDIVAYRNAIIDRFIFHRIIGMNLDHFILKGDNNSWIDSYEPVREELVGKLWLYIRNVGQGVRWIRTPVYMAITVGLVGAILMAVVIDGQNGDKKKKTKKPIRSWFDGVKRRVISVFTTKPGQSGLIQTINTDRSDAITLKTTTPEVTPVRDMKDRKRGEAIEVLFFSLGFLALASLILGIFAFTRPVLHYVPNDIKYQQTGAFSYNAVAPSGVYDTNTLTSGEPIFTKLTCTINLRFDYKLAGGQSQSLSGTHQLVATVVETVSSWRRTIPLEQETTFSGNSFTAHALLNLCQIQELVKGMEKQTELNSAVYSLVINPHVKIQGEIADQSIQDTFEPPLTLQFDETHAYIYNLDPKTDPLNPTQEGIIKSQSLEVNFLPLFGLHPEVSKMRTLSEVVLSLSLVGLLALSVFIVSSARRSQQAYFQMKYASMLIDVRPQALDTTLPTIDVVTMDDLAKIAERQNALILHETNGLSHRYFVQGDRIIYRYSKSESKDGSQTAPLEIEADLRQGIERGEFQVYYQPIISITDNKIIAVEALLRWQHPRRGLVSASEFILAAEKSGLIDTIGEWVLKAACAQVKAWQGAGLDIKLAVNFSERQLENDPADFIAGVLQTTGINPQTLQIEIPGTSVVANAQKVIPNLQKLKHLGVQISLDDFTGQLPLAALGQFAIDRIKIDRLYIEHINDPEKAVMVRNIITEARSQGLDVVAEGVETEDQLGFLRGQRCTLAQGYLLGRPAPAEEVTQLLKTPRRESPEQGPASQEETP